MRTSEITYYVEIVEPYVTGLSRCQTADQVRQYLRSWSWLVPDAVEQAKGLTDTDWAYVQKNRRRQRSAQKVARLAGAILMPRSMLFITGLRHKFHAPDGCCLIRAMELSPERLGLSPRVRRYFMARFGFGPGVST